jgi:hypothetical protein
MVPAPYSAETPPLNQVSRQSLAPCVISHDTNQLTERRQVWRWLQIPIQTCRTPSTWLHVGADTRVLSNN